MVKKAYLNLLFILIGKLLYSQDVHDWNKTMYAREIIDSLTAEQMHGRGYVSNGDLLAAGYIKTTFQKFGLKSFGNEYYQKFNFSVNTFPGEIQFEILGKDDVTKKNKAFLGKPGVNMLIGAGCKSEHNTYPLVVFDSTYTLSEKIFERFKEKISTTACLILVDDRGVSDKNKMEYFKKAKSNYFNTVGIIEFTEKLTHTVVQQESPFLIFKLLKDSVAINVNQLKKLRAKVEIQNKLLPAHATQNVIGYVEGRVQPDSFVVFSAHYDHLGQLGSHVFFPGANDNASGCAMLLNLARYYALPENKPDYSIVFMAFAGEEVGLLGSAYYTKHPLFPLSRIRFLLNMDIMGTGEEGITVVNGTLHKNEYEELVELNKANDFLKEVKIRGKAANSDHYHFSENGVKTFFIYTLGGIKAYHDVYDKAETLPLTKFEELFKLIIRFTDYLQHYQKI